MSPVIYDETLTYNFSDFVLNLLKIMLIASVLFTWVLIFDFDGQTWKLLTIFEMILGSASETVAFVFALMIGFFFGSDLVSGFTSVSFVSRVERPLETFQGLKNNNITLILMLNPKAYLTFGFCKALVDSNVSYKLMRDYNKYDGDNTLKETGIFKNISFTTKFLEVETIRVPQQIFVNKQLVASISNIKELESVWAWGVLSSYNIFVEDLSDIFWRITESQGLQSSSPSYRARRSKFVETKCHNNTFTRNLVELEN